MCPDYIERARLRNRIVMLTVFYPSTIVPHDPTPHRPATTPEHVRWIKENTAVGGGCYYYGRLFTTDYVSSRSLRFSDDVIVSRSTIYVTKLFRLFRKSTHF